MSFESKESKGPAQPPTDPNQVIDQFEELMDGYDKLPPETRRRADALIDREGTRKLLREVGSLFNKKPLLRENPEGELPSDFHLGQKPRSYTSSYQPGGGDTFFTELLKGLQDGNSTDGFGFGAYSGALRPLFPPRERLAEADTPSDEDKGDTGANPEN